MLGTQELLLILGAGVLLFGARKIPEIARGLGRSMTEFKKGMKEDDEAAPSEERNKETPPPRRGAGDDSSADAGDVG
jgi:sec-independent protein translocase protein TatA